ncbi:MAG: hypothetical protein AB1714_10235 [Acidobacteriota bacterium]
MRIWRGVAVLFVALVCCAALGAAERSEVSPQPAVVSASFCDAIASIPFELDVQVAPQRQEVLYPFNARIYVKVIHADTGLPVPLAKVQVKAVYTDAMSGEIAVISKAARTKPTGRKVGMVWFDFKAGARHIGTSIELQITARKGAWEGCECAYIDVIDCCD